MMNKPQKKIKNEIKEILEASENETTTYWTEAIRQKFIPVHCITL